MSTNSRRVFCVHEVADPVDIDACTEAGIAVVNQAGESRNTRSR